MRLRDTLHVIPVPAFLALSLFFGGCGPAVTDANDGAASDTTTTSDDGATEETEEGPSITPTPPPSKSRVGKRMTVSQLQASIPILAGPDKDGFLITWRTGGGTNPSATEMFASNQLGPTLGHPDYIERTEESAIPNSLYVKLMDDMARQVCTNMAEADRKRADTDARVLTRETTLDSIEPDDIETNVRYLHLRFFGERPHQGEDPTIAALSSLFFTAHDEAVTNGDQVANNPILEGWRVVCIAMMKSPEFHIY